ncbi:GNAT family N-acetyltransferase [Mucilaginibacter pallidiroseus]|uniref:GNAT family N-acetyltransferase n=1 Tax=Mucilaginibacter pallidiroseus TaxID=2599295 RepID=A0A563U070_9SPHI|nr:GNAT family N-acetyltransferase [Mucilaginibacter pallidiroseus]TWR24402.1 GNAT family N-acetyltransferase [Mucilaginibacter pallidiroseus]
MLCKKVQSAEDIDKCKDLILAFRPHLDAGGVSDQVTRMIRDGGFEIVYAVDENTNNAMAFAGYRKYEMLRTGKIIYIDDMYTAPESRKKGCAAALLGFIESEAREQEVQSIHLDSGYALHPAHRLYLNQGYILACNHFAKPLA